jgi:hypothetical protein
MEKSCLATESSSASRRPLSLEPRAASICNTSSTYIYTRTSAYDPLRSIVCELSRTHTHGGGGGGGGCVPAVQLHLPCIRNEFDAESTCNKLKDLQQHPDVNRDVETGGEWPNPRPLSGCLSLC